MVNRLVGPILPSVATEIEAELELRLKMVDGDGTVWYSGNIQQFRQRPKR